MSGSGAPCGLGRFDPIPHDRPTCYAAPDEFEVAMAIVREGRPMLELTDGAPPGETGMPLDTTRWEVAVAAGRAVGRVHAGTNIASGFLCAPDLVLTLHLGCVEGVGDRDVRSTEAVAFEIGGERIPARVRFVHPHLQVIGLELARPVPGAGLVLAGRRPMAVDGTTIAVIGFPEGVATPRVSPGKVLCQHSFDLGGREIGTITHDASTRPGSSGSPVIDLGTGEVLGVHFAGRHDANHAVPAWELARDNRVRGHGVRFSTPDDPWAELWGAPPARSPTEMEETVLAPSDYVRITDGAYVVYAGGEEVGRLDRPMDPRLGLVGLLSAQWPIEDLRGLVRYRVGNSAFVNDLPVNPPSPNAFAAAVVEGAATRGLLPPLIQALTQEKPLFAAVLRDIRDRL